MKFLYNYYSPFYRLWNNNGLFGDTIILLIMMIMMIIIIIMPVANLLMALRPLVHKERCQFGGDMLSASPVPQSLLAFENGITATN